MWKKVILDFLIPVLYNGLQVQTTKGTGGDIIILEEAAQVDPSFAYETVFPLLIMGCTSILAISTLTSEINFYTRLMKMRDPVTNLPMFVCLSIRLACQSCIDKGKSHECVHLYHLVPRWQNSGRHEKLKTIMEDRPDLVNSELMGLAFDATSACFKSSHLDVMFNQPCPEIGMSEQVHIFVDPAGGGVNSDYAFVSVTRRKGLVTVSYTCISCIDSTP
jgi:hypothetical protein